MLFILNKLILFQSLTNFVPKSTSFQLVDDKYFSALISIGGDKDRGEKIFAVTPLCKIVNLRRSTNLIGRRDSFSKRCHLFRIRILVFSSFYTSLESTPQKVIPYTWYNNFISLFYIMALPEFASVYGFLLLALILFIIVSVRYLLVAGIFYLVFYTWFPSKYEARKINKKEYEQGQFKKEITYSLISSLIFSVAGAFTVILWQKGYTKVYTKIAGYGWWYLPFSLAVYMLLQETYYYWMHRWMHIPVVFKLVHKVHHDSHIASPFTAFSFHPLEGLLQAIFLPLLLLIIPIHYVVLIFLLVIMTFSSVINHLDIEIYPKNSYKIWSQWIIGASHHSLHHKFYKYNFGLYFTFWDRLRSTENPGFKEMVTLSGAEGPVKHPKKKDLSL